MMVLSFSVREKITSHFHPGGFSFVFVFLFVFLLSPSDTEEENSKSFSWSSRMVTTKQGLTRGYIYMPRGGYDGVEVFLGLPYASPPVGSLRLMPPVSGSPWSGTKMNTLPAPVCPQVFPFGNTRIRKEERTTFFEGEEGGEQEEGEVGDGHGPSESEKNISLHDQGFFDVGMINETELLKSMPRGRLTQLKRLEPFLRNQSEDCLYLNVYVPLMVAEGKTDRPVPVLVFIHGEDYSYGAGHPYDPSMLVSVGNVIVITFNFRLGILGFLNANSEGYFKSPANFALLDQVAALQWVQENIGAFGGDKTNVTLMGHGKGAMFVNFLMISNALPSSESLLFHRVILMSGSALSPFIVGLSYGKDLAKKFAGRFKCPLEPPSNMLQCLRQLPLQYFLDSELWKYFGPSDDGVVIEGGIRENVMRDKISRFPMMFGVTRAEFLPTLTEHDATYGIETEKRREILKQFIDGFYSSPYRSEILAAAVHEYTDWERPVQHPISVRDETLDALADAQIVAPMVKVGELHSQSSSRTYFYVFEYQSKVSDFVQRLGCVPGEDLVYVFGIPLVLAAEEEGGTTPISTPRLGVFTGNFSKNEILLSHTLLYYWANFVKTGNPNGETLTPETPSSSSGGENRFSPHPDKSSSSSGSSTTKPRLIEWPPYDSLFKKYLSIEAKPRVRNHYRAHKLSFWLHLVPELMKSTNNDGTGSSGGLALFNNRLDPNGIMVNASTTSAVQHPPSIQLVGPPYWEQHPFYYSPGSRPQSPHHPSYGEGGIQIYSTALSVTIAVGCSFLILNIMIFAIFYYLKDKRRNSRNNGINQPHNQQQQYSHPHPDQSHTHSLPQSQNITNPTTELPSLHETPVRVKENGQLPIANQQQQPMPNICGDLPLSNLQQLLQPSSTPRNTPTTQKPKPNPNNPQQSFELSVPDAILAAAMMLNYKQQQHQQQQLSKTLGRTVMKEQLLLRQGQSLGGGGGGGRSSSSSGTSSAGPVPFDFDSGQSSSSKTVPRPPKRHTPTVKFSPATYIASPSPAPESDGGGSNVMFSPGGDVNVNNSSGTGSPRATGMVGQSSQLKSSLKKHSSYQQQQTHFHHQQEQL